MKFLADENVEWPIVLHLRDRGFDLMCIKEILAGGSDDEILKLADREKRILLTNDLDFGRLVLQQKKDFPGLILMRFFQESSSKKIEVLDHLLKLHGNKLAGHFTVVSEARIRIRPLG